MAEGVVDVVPGLVAKTRNVSVGHGNATRTDLNGGKVSSGERIERNIVIQGTYIADDLRNERCWGGSSTSSTPHQVFRFSCSCSLGSVQGNDGGCQNDR